MSTISCDGCLGSRTCWICTGNGCARCGGDGVCPLCRVPSQAPAEGERVEAVLETPGR